MDRVRKLELIERSLGIRHKLKVHESMKAPDSHEELSIMMLSKWELEDELRAIEELLAHSRFKNVAAKRLLIGKEDDTIPPDERAIRSAQADSFKTKKKKPS